MKTAEEILKETSEYNKWLSELSCSEEITLLYMMKEYAIEVAKEALMNADKRIGHTPYYRNLIKDKILSETNIPKLD